MAAFLTEPKLKGKAMLNLDNLTYEQLLTIRLEVNQRIAQIEEQAFTKLSAGEPVKGFRLKKGRAVRKVKNEGLLVQSLRDRGIQNHDMYQAKLLGVPALEKLVWERFGKKEGSTFLDEYIEKTISEPKLEYVGA